MAYPEASDLAAVGTYPAQAFAGGGYVWDEVLEYRVWCHLRDGLEDRADGDDYFYAFGTYDEALELSGSLIGAAEPLALVLQREYIDEAVPGTYRHIQGAASPSGRSSS